MGVSPVPVWRGVVERAGILDGFGALLVMVSACSGATDARPRVTIEIVPSTVALMVRSQAALQATVSDAAGRVVRGTQVFWSTEDAAVAEVSATGIVTGEGPGRVRVAASAGGVTGTATVTVAAVEVTSVVVVPQSVTIAPGATAQLQAAAYDAAGHIVDGLPVQWGSGNQAIADVDGSGVVTGKAVGSTAVSAAIGGQFASATVVVATGEGGGGGGGGGSGGDPGHHHHPHHGGGGGGGAG